MFIQVILFAAAVLAVNAEDQYSHGHAVSSQTVIQHHISHDNHHQGHYHNADNSYYSVPTLNNAGSITPSVPSTHLAPLTHTAAIIHKTPPITHYSAPAITQAFPVQRQYAPVYVAPTKQHVTTINQHAAPTLQYAAPIAHAAPIIHAAPITHAAAITQAFPVTQYYAPVQAAPATHHVTASIAQHAAPIVQYIAPNNHAAPIVQAAPITTNYASAHNAPVTQYFSPTVIDTPQYSVSAAIPQHSSRILDYNPYAKGYSVYEPQTDDIQPPDTRRVPIVQVQGSHAVYGTNQAASSVSVIQYHEHGNNGFNSQIHHSQPLQQTQHAPQYYH